ncbi:MAG TPA: right-handed parallel beta-helix repeat-containing protein, partial [bacterium]|nr:right-handed parallel beta-helix repeat-containing protein [bacterium]
TILSSCITIYFDTPIIDENGNALDYDNDDHIYGFHIFRADSADVLNGDSSNWYGFLYDTVLVSSSNNPNYYTDNNVANGETYYYRVTAFDSHQSSVASFQNEAWYSNIMRVYNIGGIDTNLPNIWYVDVANGDTGYNGLTVINPKKYASNIFGDINGSQSLLTQGDTVFFAAGLYSDTIIINTDAISIIGTDSSSVIINPPGDSNTTTLYGIFASIKNNILIKNLKIVDCNYGINFDNVDTSIIDNVYFLNNGKSSGAGCYLSNTSDSFLIRNCYFYDNYFGLSIANCEYGVLNGNLIDYGRAGGIYLNSVNYSEISGNISRKSSLQGFYLSGSNQNNIFDNIAENNSYQGFKLNTVSYSNFKRNVSRNNSNAGFYINSNSNNNRFASNLIQNNINGGEDGHGFYVNSSKNNYFVQNEIDSNQGYGFYIEGVSNSDTFNKNNWSGSPYNPDSAIYVNCADTIFDFNYNYWNSTDSASISSKFYIIAGNIIQTPYRTTLIDTQENADSKAPAIPAFIKADTLNIGSIVIEWTKPALDEDGGSLSGLSG